MEIDLVYMFRRSNDTDMVDWPGETVPTHESKFKFELVLNVTFDLIDVKLTLSQ